MKRTLKLGALIFVMVLGILAAGCASATPTLAPLGTPSSVAAVVTAKGEVIPVRYARVSFQVSGTLAKISVKEGDAVKAGDMLAQLDTKDLQKQVQVAQDALELAQATLTQTKTPATPEEIAVAQAGVDSAVAALNKLKQGATAADLAAAQSAYASAISALTKIKNGPTGQDLEILKANLDKAKVTLDQAQAAYDRIGGATNPQSALTPQAHALQQATLDYQIAEANYQKAVNPDAAAIAQAQAAVSQAYATLTKLKNGATPADIAEAQAGVDQAQAALNLKKQGARPEDIAVAEARVKQAQTGLDQAKDTLSKANLIASFDGTVTNIALQEGEAVQAGAPVATLADLTTLRVQTTDLDEFGAAKVKVGQAAKVRVNAFTDKTLTGKATEVAQQSVILSTGDVSYVVTLALDQQDPELRWGMTVKVEFQQ